MKHHHPEAKKRIVLAAAALCLLTVLTAPVAAQRSGGGRPTPVDRRVAEERNRRIQLEHDVMLGDIKATSEKPTDQKQPRAAINQVQQDFERIQTIYNEIVRGMQANSAFGYKFISDAATEIKKRANRLKINLALPRADDDQKRKKEQTALNDEQMKPSLLILTSHIRSFVMNPLFESGGVLDVELSKKASRDLSKIIELSDHLRKSAEKLDEAKK